MTQLVWVLRDLNGIEEALGAIPELFDANDPRPCAQQVNERYAHGGGWQPSDKRRWRLEGATLVYDCGPEEPDEEYMPLAFTVHPLTKEMIVIYDFAYVLITPPPSDDPYVRQGFEVARCD